MFLTVFIAAALAPAGIDAPNTGHRHLPVNADPDAIDMDASLPATDEILRFGTGPAEARVKLPAGTNELRLLLGDANHIPRDPPPMSEAINVTVAWR